MTTDYRKDLSGTSWATVYARQMARAPLVSAWLDALDLHPGDHVIDVGSGPGYVSLQAAARVGPTGLVYAVDRSAEALDYLAGLQEAQGVDIIRRVLGDAASLDIDDRQFQAALITMVLHHTDDPERVVCRVGGMLPAGGRLVIAEFHPEGPCEIGAPAAERLHPDRVRRWCTGAGLREVRYERQTPEHYCLVLERL